MCMFQMELFQVEIESLVERLVYNSSNTIELYLVEMSYVWTDDAVRTSSLSRDASRLLKCLIIHMLLISLRLV